MKRSGTLVNTLKASINDVRTSTLFVQTLYESANFNINKDTSEVLNDYFNKNAFMNSEQGISNTQFRKEKMNNTSQIGRQAAKIFNGTILTLKD